VQVRLFVPPDRPRQTVAVYRALTGRRCTLHFLFPGRRLELASGGSCAVSFLYEGTDVLPPRYDVAVDGAAATL
jgi:hypothetical protein